VAAGSRLSCFYPSRWERRPCRFSAFVAGVWRPVVFPPTPFTRRGGHSWRRRPKCFLVASAGVHFVLPRLSFLRPFFSLSRFRGLRLILFVCFPHCWPTSLIGAPSGALPKRMKLPYLFLPVDSPGVVSFRRLASSDACFLLVWL